jgi:hypothetical protein
MQTYAFLRGISNILCIFLRFISFFRGSLLIFISIFTIYPIFIALYLFYINHYSYHSDSVYKPVFMFPFISPYRPRILSKDLPVIPPHAYFTKFTNVS